MQPDSPRKLLDDSSEDENLFKHQFLPIQKTTKPKFTSFPPSLSFSQSNLPPQSAFAKIISSFAQQQQRHHFDHRSSSTLFNSSKTSNYQSQTIIQIIQKNEVLDSLFNNPSKYICYQLLNYYLVLVGPVAISLQVSDKIGLYIPSQNQNLTYQDKKIIRIQRRAKKQKQNIFDYPYYVCEPNQILFPTLIFKWLNCLRNTFLESYFGVDRSNYYMLLGLTGHTVLQKLVNKQIAITLDKQVFYREVYYQYIDKMYLLNIKQQQFVKDCKEKFQNIYEFYNNHVLKKQEIELNKYKKQYLKITKVIGTEYTIKSDIFGMKGKVDLLLQCSYINKKQNTQRKVIVPFQLKTGHKQCHTHIYQVHVYNLLILQIFKTESIGLLFYPQTKKIIPVVTDMMNVHELLIKRNQYVVNRKRKAESTKIKLPKHTVNTPSCLKCNLQKQCISVSLTQFKDIEDIVQIQNYQFEDTKKIIALIDDKSKEYIDKWLILLHLEQRAKERQYNTGLKAGLTKFKLLDVNKFLFDINDKKQIAQVVLRSKQLNTGDTQTIQNMYKVSDKLRMNILIVRSALYIEVQKIKKMNNRVFLVCKINLSNILFDKSELGTDMLDIQVQKFGYLDTFSSQRYTVVDYCISENRHFSYKFVVDKYAGQFTVDNRLKWYYEKNIKDSEGYNTEQKEAIRKALLMKDFSLVEGYPGTGKTFLILALIKIFRQIGLKVLVTSFTNTSLNNILKKIMETNMIPKEEIVRIGNKSLRQGEFKYVSFDPQSFKSLPQISQYFSSKYLWFVTLTSTYNELIPSDFDLVIVDQASQCIEPLCLNSIQKAKKFVLVGDYKQLGPLITDQYASDQGMKVSLFQKLCVNYPQFTTPLVKQWRMCSEIMELTNNLIYNNLLECANQNVFTQILNINQYKSNNQNQELIKRITDPLKPIRFLSMDTIAQAIKNINGQASDFNSSSLFKLEVNLTSSVYKIFRKLNLLRQQISIISFFNRSNIHIVKRLKQQELIENNQGDVLTIDKSQGIDKECIIFLMENGGERNKLTRDINRLNVSLTRAKSKLVIIGSETEARSVFNEKVFQILMRNQVKVTEELVEEIFVQKMIK